MTPYSQFVGVQAAMNVILGARKKLPADFYPARRADDPGDTGNGV